MKIGEKYIVSKKQLLDLIESLRKQTDVIGPVQMPDGEVSFEKLKSAKDITFDYVNEYIPLKRFLTPATEEMFRFSTDQKVPEITPTKPVDPFILFGVRSCDVQGFAHMDGFFSGAFKDNYYWDHRDRMTVISMACNKPLDTCFCICCNGGPWLDSGFDLQLTDFGDRFLIDVGSEKGMNILEKLGEPIAVATQRDEFLRQELMQKCDEQMIPKAYLAKAVIQITNNRVREELWEEMGAECFSCGGCTNVCPLCTCFDVFDTLSDEDKGIRYRCWDSCQYSGFTREASGHNPRARVKERVKRRFYHKLSYAYIQLDGHPGCVGCGRCITVCEAFDLLDIANVVKRIRRDGQPEKAKKPTENVLENS
jgi:heterodisulfide reductase subunit C